MRDGVDPAAVVRRRHMWSALLSTVTAVWTAGVLIWTMLSADSTYGRFWYWWVLSVGLPPIALSVAAAVQYRWGHSTGAGAAAAVLYCAFLLVFNFAAAAIFLFGAPLQTAAWFLSRPKSQRQRTPSTVTARDPTASAESN